MRTKAHTYVWQYAALAAYLVFLALPVLWLFATAFKSQNEILALHPSWLPQHVSMGNFTDALSEQPLVHSALNSLLVAGGAALLTVLLAIPGGYLMARRSGVGTRIAMGWVLASQMFPFILILIPLFLTMISVGLYDSLIGLVLVYTVWNLPFALWMLRNFVRAIPVDLEEQASTDGAVAFQRLRYVVAPLLIPGLVTSVMFAFINSWNEFFFASVLIQDDSRAPLSLLLVRFIGHAGAVRLGPLAAASLLATIPSLVFFAVVQRRLTSGLLSGAVKA